MVKPVVVVTRRWPQAVEDRLSADYDVCLNQDDTPMSVTELQYAMQNADAVLPTVTDVFDAEIINVNERRTRILGNFGVGFNHIDLEAATVAGITVTNTPDVLTDCTADIAMMLLLMTARRGAEGDRHVRDREWIGWRPTHMLGTKVTGKTLGLIGMGRIARAMAKKAHHGFNMPILYYNPSSISDDLIADLNAVKCDSPEDVLSRADFVSLHCPGGEQTFHLINADRLKLMKPTAHLINTARGDVVDTLALINALRNGTIAGAGLDVFEGEPHVNPELLTLDNVSLLPHLGSATQETRIAMGHRVVDNLDAFFRGADVIDRVV
ncbi:MAG: D-glycerate dehydrogenase [Gammaproteobacteria bacterium]|nr:D-glycerate dehydrogenase [Gammaproteobacteria bacterium]